jgi:hypothetical protein
MRSRFATFLGLMASVATPLAAQQYAYDTSAPVEVAEVVPYTTTFSMLEGMEVNWVLSNGTLGSGTWMALGDGKWGVWTDDFKLWGNGASDTWDNRWNLWSMDLASFSVNAVPGNSVFDVVRSPDQTPGSESGRKFSGWWGYYDEDDIKVTYSNPVALVGMAPMYDIWGRMTVKFLGGEWDYSCAAGSLEYKNGKYTCKTSSTNYGQPTIDYDCDSGYTLTGNLCVRTRSAEWRNGSWRCDSGYSLVRIGSAWKCQKSVQPEIDYDCPSGSSLVWYNGAKACKSTTYEYSDPTKTWEPEHFGISSKCSAAKSPTYDYGAIDNEKCYAKFYQDMDNVIPEEPGNPNEVVPEPATMTLLATGLAGMAATRRRRKQR